MFSLMRKNIVRCAIVSAFSLHVLAAGATGMVPETSLLFVNEADQGASINIKNTDDKAQLLYTSITDIAEDTGTHLVVTQPVVRVEGGQTQNVRFILQTDAPLKVEHMKRVVFEGIPQKTPGANKIAVNIRQDLPVLIHPANLPEVQDAWTLLTWKAQGNSITLSNTSPYVVRFQPAAVLIPSNTLVRLPKTYILPGQTINVDAGKSVSGNTQVQFSPVSRYGVQIDKYTTQLAMH